MTFVDFIQLSVFVVLLTALTKPVGLYLVQVLDPKGKTFLDPVVGPLERLCYRISGIPFQEEQDWKGYAISLLAFSVTGMLFTYAVLRTQHLLPLNPRGLGPVSPDLAFNTAASFASNTNWQNYAGESTLSYFSQMVGLAYHNFVSAAAGIGVAAALVRGICRNASKTVGNFWTDMVRLNLYLLLPASLIFALFLVSQGTVQNFSSYTTVRPVEVGAAQSIVQGPMASQVAIKILGTNGGGYTNANAAHPYENPTPLSNFFQMLSIFLIPSGLTYYFGRASGNRRHGWAVWLTMMLLFLSGVVVGWWAEISGNPRLDALGVATGTGNMEGKETRFGIFGSVLFAVITTDASCGAVNAMHDSFTPLGGLVPLVNIQLGEVVFGGVGAGLYGMIVFIILAVFLAGLMVGRTPEYLGKKIESYDVKMSVLSLMVFIFSVLGFTAWSAVSSWGMAALGNKGPHGFTELLYAFSSASANNGSAFAGLSGNTPILNTTLGLAMLLGRFFAIVPIMALAGNLARKKRIPESEGTFPVYGPTFILLLAGTVLIVGALTFFPALSLGPVVEHFLLLSLHAPLQGAS